MKFRAGQWIRSVSLIVIAVFVSGTALGAQEATKKFGGTAVPAVVNEQTKADFAAGTGPADVPTDRLALVFLLICGLLYLTYFGMKKYSSWSRNSVNKKRSVGVLDTIPLGGKRYVTVTRVYDRILVLGVGEDNITLLTELKEGEEATPAIAAAATNSTKAMRGVKPAEHFANLLASLTKKRTAKEATVSETAQPETAIL